MRIVIPQQTILIVDDDQQLRETLRSVLAQYDFNAEEAKNGAELRQVIDNKPIDLILLDLGLGGEDGLALVREIQRSSDIPIIMLTGRSDIIDKIVGLEIGADDYITKPFHNRELIARIMSVLRRSQKTPKVNGTPVSSNNNVAKFGGWELGLSSQSLVAPDGQNASLTAYEFRILALLVQNAKKTLSRDRILDLARGQDWSPSDRSIDVIVGKLRKKLGDNPVDPTYIKTIRSFGYMFIADVEFEYNSGWTC